MISFSKTYFIGLFWVVLIAFSVFADLGPKPEKAVSVTLDGSPFSDAFISLKECVEFQENPGNDYSLAGLGRAASAFSDPTFMYAAADPAVSAEDVFANPDFNFGLSQGQFEQIQAFVYPIPDTARNCFWIPGYRAFTDCDETRCRFTYLIPEQFRIDVLDMRSGKLYSSQLIDRVDLFSELQLDFNSETTSGELKPATVLTNPSKVAAAFLTLFLANLVIEFLAGIFIIFVFFKLLWKKSIVAIAGSNIVSYPIAFLAFQSYPSLIFVIELIIVIFEALVLKKMVSELTLKKALLISIVLNAVSFGFGLLFL